MAQQGAGQQQTYTRVIQGKGLQIMMDDPQRQGGGAVSIPFKANSNWKQPLTKTNVVHTPADTALSRYVNSRK